MTLFSELVFSSLKAQNDTYRDELSRLQRIVNEGTAKAAQDGVRDGLSMALAVVELYGMKGDVIHQEILKLRDKQ